MTGVLDRLERGGWIVRDRDLQIVAASSFVPNEVAARKCCAHIAKIRPLFYDEAAATVANVGSGLGTARATRSRSLCSPRASWAAT
jgi:hypothetical protein